MQEIRYSYLIFTPNSSGTEAAMASIAGIGNAAADDEEWRVKSPATGQFKSSTHGDRKGSPLLYTTGFTSNRV